MRKINNKNNHIKMKDLKVNHIYLAKKLPVKRAGIMMFSSDVVDKEKEIQRIVVKEITDTCYLISFEGKDTSFYVEKADSDIVYLEDLGVMAKTK